MKAKYLILLVLTCALGIISCDPEQDKDDEVLAIEGVSVNIAEKEMAVGETVTLKATVLPYNTDPGSIEWDESMKELVFWQSDRPDVATVTQDGTVKAIGKGTCTIMFVCGPYAAKCAVTVRDFSINGLLGQWKTDEGKDCFFSFDGTGTMGQESVTWKFDGMRFILSKSSISDTLVITSVDNGRFSYYNSSDKSKTRKLMKLSARPLTIDDLKHGIIPVEGQGGNSYDAVDLGLPGGVLWGTCNLMAQAPQGQGSFYAWAETETKENYTVDCYKWYDEGTLGLTKYIQGQPGTLNADDDAASVIMGGVWRTPTAQEIMDLYDNCFCYWASYDNTDGIMFTSKVKGYENNSVFLPFSGIKDSYYESMENDNRKIGVYWSSTLNGDDDFSAEYLQLFLIQEKGDDSLYKEIHPNATGKRYIGACIRPVANK